MLDTEGQRRDASRPSDRSNTSEMERKLAKVLFVDIVNSTRMVTAADPEVVRRRVTEFFQTVSHCAELHGGVVERFAGDAVLAAFGARQAHEDDAQRAVRAAPRDANGRRRARTRSAYRDRVG